jgi:hypothetical protein
MKKLSIVALLLTLAAISCKKTDKAAPANGTTNSTPTTIGDDSRCISRARVPQSAYTISTADYNEAVAMHNANHMAYNYLRWYRAEREYITLNGVTNYYYNLHGDQYMNGLRLLGGNVLVEEFKNGIVDWPSVITVPTTTLDTFPVLRLSQVRALYVNQLLTQYSGHYSALQDSCISAEFGYYDLNAGQYGTVGTNYTKAWMVYPAGAQAQLPVAYFKDDGTLIFFTDGVVQ